MSFYRPLTPSGLETILLMASENENLMKTVLNMKGCNKEWFEALNSALAGNRTMHTLKLDDVDHETTPEVFDLDSTLGVLASHTGITCMVVMCIYGWMNNEKWKPVYNSVKDLEAARDRLYQAVTKPLDEREMPVMGKTKAAANYAASSSSSASFSGRGERDRKNSF